MTVKSERSVLVTLGFGGGDVDNGRVGGDKQSEKRPKLRERG